MSECHVHTGGQQPGVSPTAMTRDSHGSDRGRLVGGAARRPAVKSSRAVKIAGKWSLKVRVGAWGRRSAWREATRQSRSVGNV